MTDQIEQKNEAIEPDIIVEPADNELDTQAQQEGRYRDPTTGKFAKRPEEDTENPYTLQKMPDLREKIAEKFNQARKELETQAEDEEPTARIRTEEQKAAEEAEPEPTPEPEPAPVAEAKPQPAAPTEPVPLPITVDGKVYYVDRNDARWSSPGATDDQVRNWAQMYWATQNRLAEANQLLDSARSRTGAPADQSGGVTGSKPVAASEQGETKLSPERLGEIADRLQLGNRDEAQAALEELVGLVREAQGPAVNSEQLREEMRRELVAQENKREIDRAIGKFEADNPDLKDDRYLVNTVIDMAVDHMVNGMRQAGVTDQMLAPLQGRKETIAQVYADMRQDGRFNLPSYDEVLAKAADQLRASYNRPRPTQNQVQAQTQIAQQRLEQKRQMQQQPRSAGVGSPQGQPPRPKSREEIIKEMRSQRMPWLQ